MISFELYGKLASAIKLKAHLFHSGNSLLRWFNTETRQKRQRDKREKRDNMVLPQNSEQEDSAHILHKMFRILWQHNAVSFVCRICSTLQNSGKIRVHSSNTYVRTTYYTRITMKIDTSTLKPTSLVSRKYHSRALRRGW